MRHVLIAALFALSCTTAARADVRADEKTQVTFEGVLGRMAGMFGGRGARDGVTSTVVVKGNRKATTTGQTMTIVDLDEEKVFDVDIKGKSYRVTTFGDMRRQVEEARKKAAGQEPRASGKTESSSSEVDLDFSITETGQRRAINGFDAHEVLMTIAVHEKGKSLEKDGGMVLTNSLWLTPQVSAMDEVADFDRRYAEKIAGPMLLDAQQAAALAAMYPMMQQAMARMQAENVKLAGTSVLTTVKLEAAANAEQAASASVETKNETTPASIGGLGGALGGRLGRRIIGGNNKDAAPQTPGRATVMTITHELLKVTPSASDAEVAIPAGFKLKS